MIPSRSRMLAGAVIMFEISVWTDNFSFVDQFAQKGYFFSKTEKINTANESYKFELV